MVLVLDLGRPTADHRDDLLQLQVDLRLEHHSLYGFMAIVLVYLFTMMERKMNAYSKAVGTFAFVWRLILTTGTARSRLLVAREAYNSALLAPMFIVMSFAFGTAIYILVLMYAFRADNRSLATSCCPASRTARRLHRRMWYFTLVYHSPTCISPRITTSRPSCSGRRHLHAPSARHIIVGVVIPLGILYHPVLASRAAGSQCLRMVVSAASQHVPDHHRRPGFPMTLFPDQTIIESASTMG